VHTPSGNPRTDGFYSAFLSAQGRVLHDVIVYPDSSKPPGEGFLIDVDADEAGRLERHIKRYKLRAKFAVRLVDVGEMGVWAAWGEGVAVTQGKGEVAMVDPRCPALGWRMVTSRDRPEVDLESVEERDYTIRRYLAGIPEGQKEILREQALPLESNMDIMGGIDFRKGCYVGQELTIRTKHRGVVRKRILPCMIYPEDNPAPEVLIYTPNSLAAEGEFKSAEEIPSETSIGRVEKKGRSAGKWLAGIGNVGLALCRLEIMTDLVLPGEASAGTGFSPSDEFVLTEKVEADGVGRKVKIKAFVPAWLRQGLEQGGHS
jgi:folate-binding protein YgfZ